MSPASPRMRSSRSRFCSSTNSVDSTTGGELGSDAAARAGGAWPGLGSTGFSRRGRMSVRSLFANTRRSASYCSGSSFDRPGLKTKCSMRSCFARAWTAPESVSVIMSTGGCRFILASRLTISKPPWKDDPPEVGMPRSVTSTNGMSALPKRCAFLTAPSTVSDSTTW